MRVLTTSLTFFCLLGPAFAFGESEGGVLVLEEPQGPMETIDGSAMVGYIIAENTDGRVLFKPCNNDAFALARSELQDTEVACENEPPATRSQMWALTDSDSQNETLMLANWGQLPTLRCAELGEPLLAAVNDIAIGRAASGTTYTAVQGGVQMQDSMGQFGNKITSASIADRCGAEPIAAIKLDAATRSDLAEFSGFEIENDIEWAVFADQKDVLE